MQLELYHLDKYKKGKNGILCKLSEFAQNTIFESKNALSTNTYDSTFYISNVDYESETIRIISTYTEEEIDSISLNCINLILKPISELKNDNKLINELDRISFGTFSEIFNYKTTLKLPFILFEKLLENQYDVFSLNDF